MLHQWHQLIGEMERAVVIIHLHADDFLQHACYVVIQIGIVDDVRNDELIQFFVSDRYFVIGRQLKLACKGADDALHKTVDGADGNIGIMVQHIFQCTVCHLNYLCCCFLRKRFLQIWQNSAFFRFADNVGQRADQAALHFSCRFVGECNG
ncbi:hypothetical protein DSECCO2_623590 [anaerobic digester metagenome]